MNEQDLEINPDQRRIIDSIAASFGEGVSAEAEALLREPDNKQLNLLALLAKAEERYFAKMVGSFDALSHERLNSRISLSEHEDQAESESSRPARE